MESRTTPRRKQDQRRAVGKPVAGPLVRRGGETNTVLFRVLYCNFFCSSIVLHVKSCHSLLAQNMNQNTRKCLVPVFVRRYESYRSPKHVEHKSGRVIPTLPCPIPTHQHPGSRVPLTTSFPPSSQPCASAFPPSQRHAGHRPQHLDLPHLWLQLLPHWTQ